MTINNIPDVEVKLQVTESDFSWIVENCPYCGRRHTHGAFNPPDQIRKSLGRRLAHCHGGEYNLVHNK